MIKFKSEVSKLKKFYFTFGCGQKHENGYTIVYALDKGKAREKMFDTYGAKWAMQYDSAKDAGIKEFNLKLINILKE